MRMTDEERDYYERTRKPLIPMPQSRFGKFIFALFVALWFVLLSLPCGLFYLATGGEITLSHAFAPEPESQPFFRMQLLMEPENRGFQLTRTLLLSQDQLESDLCVQTHVDYLLWQSDETAVSAVFCDCYDNNASPDKPNWNFISTQPQLCIP
jgi:hypothetical protein